MRRWARKSKILPKICHLRYQIVGCGQDFRKIVSFDLGKTPDRHNKRYWNNGKYPWFTIADLQEMGSASSSKEKISEIALNEKFAGKLIPRGTLLMSFKLTVGKTSILDVDAVHNEAIISIFPIISEHEITRNFLLNALPVLVLCVKKRDAVKGATLNSSKLATMFIPLPPLSEQQRIVSQIEELFDQIAAIEQNQTDIATLYEEFRKRTLTLAIQGKLIPQNPNDEPANVLLKRIRAEKRAKLGKKFVDSYIYKGDDNCYYEHIAGRTQDELVEVPFEIPDSWAWSRIDGVAFLQSGKPFEELESGTPYVKVSDMNLLGNNIEITTSQHYCKATSQDIIPSSSIIFPKRGGAISTNKKRKVLSFNCCIDLNTMCMTPFLSQMLEYIFSWFLTIDLGMMHDGTSVPQINNVDIYPLLVPIPPLAEQKRIVAKINEIFAML